MPEGKWSWPVNPRQYDRRGSLRKKEAAALEYLVSRELYGHFRGRVQDDLARLTQPILDVVAATGTPKQSGDGAMGALVLEMHRRQTSFWVWPREIWLEILGPTARSFHVRYKWTTTHGRHAMVAATYLLGLFDDFRALGIIDRTALACRIFGRQRIQAEIKRVIDVIRSWGFSRYKAKDIQWALCSVLLANKSPNLHDLTVDVLRAERDLTTVPYRGASIAVLSSALKHLGAIPEAIERKYGHTRFGDPRDGVDPVWVDYVERWFQTSTTQKNSRERVRYLLLKAGRWLTQIHPDRAAPDRWTRELAAEWVATVCRMKRWEWVQIEDKYKHGIGQSLSARARAHHLSSISTFFRDIQEWAWIPRRLDPRRSFAAPRSLRALIGPKPKVIANDVWAKLLWAGLNLEERDLSRHANGKHFYPVLMVKAISIVWLFSGLRVDEIHRLRIGCTRENWNTDSRSSQSAAVCNLDVPVNKTNHAFTKPVDQIVGESIRAWEAERPAQPTAIDEKTGELVHFLFMYRSKRPGQLYLNKTLVPTLCKKAGVPLEDARGRITSHRARSTIASQLFNAKEPMSLFELQRWLGHKWANSTQHYLDITPTKLAQSFRNAGYFARNVRAIDVLIDREVVVSGSAAHEPWKFYDLGHGYCTYDFFDQCPHRMACAKCGFYVAKGSSRAQLLEGKENLLRMRQEIPLNEAELAAVDDGLAALEKLLDQLADVATPAGPTPRQLRAPELAQIAGTEPEKE
jgi:Phage integrase family